MRRSKKTIFGDWFQFRFVKAPLRAAALGVVLAGCVGLWPVAAQTTPDEVPPVGRRSESVLFVHSDPIRSIVFVDDEPVAMRTPAVVTGLRPGRHRIEVRRDGFLPAVQEIVIRHNGVHELFLPLERDAVVSRFFGEEFVIINNEPYDPQAGLISLPDGQYQFTRRRAQLFIESRYPRQGMLDFTGFSIPILALLAAGLTTYDLVYPATGAATLSPLTLLSYGLLTAGIGTAVALSVEKDLYLAEQDVRFVPATVDLSGAERSFEQAETLLSIGRFDEALRFYTLLTTEFPDSALYPDSLYKAARIYQINGDAEIAELLVRLLLERYPSPNVYDAAVLTLSDLEAAKGDFLAAAATLGRLVFIEEIIEEGDALRLQQEYLELAQSPAGGNP